MGGYMSLFCFHNGSLARERIRDEHRLDWEGFSRLLRNTRAGNDGALMLPWFEREITPHVANPGVCRIDLDASDAARNVRAVVEAQMMSMANRSASVAAGRIVGIVVMGGASANREILQIMADVFGADVSPARSGNAACLGAALRAFHADRLADRAPVAWDEVVAGFAEPDPRIRIAPIPAHVAVYAALRKRYAALEDRALQPTGLGAPD
jgi:xylulokinase